MLLVLWDIDHTLIDNGGVSKETYAAAFEILTGQPASHRARTDGRTDPEIMRDLLRQHGIEPTSEHMAGLHDALTGAMKAKTTALRERGHALPGAKEAIAALKAVPGVIQSVLSGNIRDNAYVKLSTFDLADDLDWEVGGYGSDSNYRPALVKVAQDRAQQQCAVPFDAANTVLIGDTVRDVRAALQGGARIVAVTTGTDTPETLHAEGATVVLPNLHDTTAVVTAITANT